jgi:ketosteroid isomerase-like protein
VSSYAADVLFFDVVNPLRSTGSDAGRKRLAEGVSAFRGPIGYEVRDLDIAAAVDVAFCHSLRRVRATTKTGQRLDMGWRATICYRKVDGAWRVTHEHASVPFDVASGRASLDLEP